MTNIVNLSLDINVPTRQTASLERKANRSHVSMGLSLVTTLPTSSNDAGLVNVPSKDNNFLPESHMSGAQQFQATNTAHTNSNNSLIQKANPQQSVLKNQSQYSSPLTSYQSRLASSASPSSLSHSRSAVEVTQTASSTQLWQQQQPSHHYIESWPIQQSSLLKQHYVDPSVAQFSQQKFVDGMCLHFSTCYAVKYFIAQCHKV